MNKIENISEICQDLFAWNSHQIIKPHTSGYWVDFGARNWGTGFGQNNTVLLYNNGWKGLSMDIEDFSSTYSNLDSSRVHFEQIDCTNSSKIYDLFKNQNVPKQIDYLNFDIDESTEKGLITLEGLLEKGYTFNIITIEHDSYRFGIKIRDKQRNLLEKYNYIRVAELDLYEDWWIYSDVYTNKFEILKPISSILHKGGFNQEDLNFFKETINKLI